MRCRRAVACASCAPPCTDFPAGRDVSFDDVVATPVPPRFEDGLWCFCNRGQTRSKKTDKETRRQGKRTGRQGDTRQGRQGDQGDVSLSRRTPSFRSAIWCANSAVSLPLTTSASMFNGARSSACSVRTARERLLRFACCADCCPLPAARCEWPEWICVAPALRRASGSATSPRSSHFTASSR